MAQITFTVSSVAGSGSKTQDVAAFADLAYITRINVVPSAAGDSYQVQLFRDDGFTAGNLSYDSGAVTGTHEDPIEDDGTTETQHGQDALIVSVYRDDDGTSELHVKVTNNDASTRSFDFIVDYIVPSTLSAPLSLTGSSDAVQLTVTGHSTQTSDVFVVETSAGTDIFTVGNTGIADLRSSAPKYRLTDSGNSGYSDVQTNGAVLTIDCDPGAADAGSAVAVNLDGAEVARWDSTGLGLGTAAPATSIHVSAADPVIRLEDTGISGHHEISGNTSQLTIEADPTAADASTSIGLYCDGVEQFRIEPSSAATLQGQDLGNDTAGPVLLIGRNSSAGAEGPAPGVLRIVEADGNSAYVYADDSRVLRIHSAQPTGSSGTPTVDITAGTVVGTQTSLRSEKWITGSALPAEIALEKVVQTKIERFRYRDGRYGNQEFEGPVIDDSKSCWFALEGKALNPITTVGYLILSVQALYSRVMELEGKNRE